MRKRLEAMANRQQPKAIDFEPLLRAREKDTERIRALLEIAQRRDRR